jgi:hypothetical protein
MVKLWMFRTALFITLVHFPYLISCGQAFDQKYYVIRHDHKLDFDSIQTNETDFIPYKLPFDSIDYQCFIPINGFDESIEKNRNMNITELEIEKNLATDIIKNFNFNLRDESVIKERGYWSYAVRFDHDIHQFHRDMTENGPGALFDYKLAAWSDNDDTNTFESIPYYKDERHYKDPYSFKSDFEMIKLEDGTKYVSQRISNGEICDLTGLPRSTTINYFCNDKHKAPFIKEVHEWRTCEYIIDLESNEFCGHSMWTPPKTLVNNHIDCFPTTISDEPINKILDSQDLKLDPLTNGMFLAKKGDSLKFSLLLVKNYDLWSVGSEEYPSHFQNLLMDLSLGFQRYIKNKKLMVASKDTFVVLSLVNPFKIIFEVYDIDKSYIGNIKLDQDENGFIVASFVDDDVPEEGNLYLEFETFFDTGNEIKKETEKEDKQKDEIRENI